MAKAELLQNIIDPHWLDSATGPRYKAHCRLQLPSVAVELAQIYWINRGSMVIGTTPPSGQASLFLLKKKLALKHGENKEKELSVKLNSSARCVYVKKASV